MRPFPKVTRLKAVVGEEEEEALLHTELECLSSYFLRPRSDTVCVMRLLAAAAGANQCNSNLRIREPRRVEGVSKAVHISSQEVKLYVPCFVQWCGVRGVPVPIGMRV